MSVLARPMTPISAPSTPQGQPSAPSTPQTGTWRHPQLDEILQRQNASTFSDRNVKQILHNAGGLVAVWLVGRLLWINLPSFFDHGKLFHPYSIYAYRIIQVLLVSNIVLALLPLFRAKDDISDIPLTPAQRKLLGLPPSSAKPTPGAQYITPPRYERTSTPLSGSPRSNAGHSSSPRSNKGSPAYESISGSPFSPMTSPLLQKAIGGGFGGTRRHSYGSPSPLGPKSAKMNGLEMPGTPSPSSGKGVSVGLNNKWLYEKSRRNSGNDRLFS